MSAGGVSITDFQGAILTFACTDPDAVKGLLVHYAIRQLLILTSSVVPHKHCYDCGTRSRYIKSLVAF